MLVRPTSFVTQPSLNPWAQTAYHHTMQRSSLEPPRLPTPDGTVQALRLLGRGKSGYSWHATYQEGTRRGEEVILKAIHHEPNQYFHFGDKFEAEVHAYDTLQSLGVPVPALHHVAYEEEILIKEFVRGGTVSELLAASPEALTPRMLESLADSNERVPSAGLNIDYFPSNFVWNDDRLYYVDYEVVPYSDEWNFANWGVYYWANGRGMKAFLETGDHRFINRDDNSGRPLTEGLDERVAELLSWFADTGYSTGHSPGAPTGTQ